MNKIVFSISVFMVKKTLRISTDFTLTNSITGFVKPSDGRVVDSTENVWGRLSLLSWMSAVWPCQLKYLSYILQLRTEEHFRSNTSIEITIYIIPRILYLGHLLGQWALQVAFDAKVVFYAWINSCWTLGRSMHVNLHLSFPRDPRWSFDVVCE